MDEKKLDEAYDMLWGIYETALKNGKTGVIVNLDTLLKILNKIDDGMGR